MSEPSSAIPRPRRLGFALCLAGYVVSSVAAIRVGVLYSSLQAPTEARGLVTAVSWVSGASAAALNLGLILWGGLVAIVVMAWVVRMPARPSLLFEAPWVVALAAITPTASFVFAWVAPESVSSAQEFDVLAARVLAVSMAALAVIVAYVWWFLRTRFDASAIDAALSTLAGVAASYALVTMIQVVGGILGFA